MIVESAMRQARRAHQFGDADAVEALFAKQLRRRVEHPLVIVAPLAPS